MKPILFFLLVVWLQLGIAQNKQILYGLQEVPQSIMLNPGSKVQHQKHLGIPFFSQIHFNGGASGLSAFDIFGNTGEDINAKIERKIFEMSPNDFFTANQQLEIIQLGWRAKNGFFFSGGMYQELDFITYFPRDLAILGWEGNAGYLDYEFDLGQVSATGDLLTVYHFGANKQITQKLTVGARAKVYSSILSFRSVNNQGTFVTTLGDENSNNFYEHTVRNADMKLETSGIASLSDGASAGSLLGRAFFGGNLGLGMDLGATYDITSNWTVTASLLDIGVIFHSKDVETYHAYGDYTLDGINLIFPPLSEGEETFPYYDDLEDEIEREIPIDTLTNAYTQFRPLKMNAGLQYSFGRAFGGSNECDCRNRGGGVDREQAIGIQYYSIARPKGLQMAGTLYYRRNVFDFLTAKATYTVDAYSFSNVGLGIVADLGKFNFYIAMDNLLKYGNLAKAKSVSLQLGFNIKIHEE